MNDFIAWTCVWQTLIIAKQSREFVRDYRKHTQPKYFALLGSIGLRFAFTIWGLSLLLGASHA